MGRWGSLVVVVLVLGFLVVGSFVFNKDDNVSDESIKEVYITDRFVEYGSGSDLSKLIKSNEKVLLEFRAEWCPYCKEFEEGVPDYLETREDLTVVKIDIDDFPMLADEYEVMVTPTLYYYKDGKVVTKAMGALPEEQLDSFLEYN